MLAHVVDPLPVETPALFAHNIQAGYLYPWKDRAPVLLQHMAQVEDSMFVICVDRISHMLRTECCAFLRTQLGE